MLTINEMEAHLTLLGFIFDDDGIRARGIKYFVHYNRVMAMDGTRFVEVYPTTYFVYKITEDWTVKILGTKSHETALRKLYELVTIK